MRTTSDVLLPYEITLLSNAILVIIALFVVLLPYEITLLSNVRIKSLPPSMVLLPYEITLLSNRLGAYRIGYVFYYLMKLHYSQTFVVEVDTCKLFYYLMKLHYSQT